MNTTMSIWGEPLVTKLNVFRSAWDSFEAEEDSIERELRTFVEDEIRCFNPDLILVYERKGTAILRALIECSDSPLNWPWQKVISSTAFDQLPVESLRNRKILIFDDMVRTGDHIRKALARIFHKVFGIRVKNTSNPLICRWLCQFD